MYSNIETRWITLYALYNNVAYFHSFGVEHIPKEIKIFIDKSIVVTNVFRIQAYDSVICGYFCIRFIDFMRSGKTLTDFTNLFVPNNFKKNDDIILKYFMTNISKMVECNSHQTHNIYPNLNHQQHFRLKKINEIKDYFAAEIEERELMSKRLSKYIAFFDCFDKALIVLFVLSGSISVSSLANAVGAPIGIVTASFSLAFSIFTGTVKKLLKTSRNKKEIIIKLLC